MGNKTMPAGRHGALLLLAWVAGACNAGSDPDPRPIAAALAATRPQSQPDAGGPLVVVAELSPSQTPPAPTAETSAREGVPDVAHTIVAVGRNAAHTVDSIMTHAVGEAWPELEGNYLACSDRDAAELLMVGRADFAVIGGPLSQRELHAGIRQTRIGVELFALAVATDSPVRSLSRTQVRQVLTGEVTQWQQLGHDGGTILVVAPADRNLAERAAHALIPGDDFAATATRATSEQQVADQVLQNRGAIGVVHVLDQPLQAGQKLLHIDWCPPTAEAFGYGTYPFGQPVHVITSGQPTGSALKFLEFSRSEGGRSLLQRSLLVR